MNEASPNTPLAPLPAGSSREAEDAWLWASFRHHSRTFSLAARLLPADVRLPVATLYLYCRTVDGIADERVFEVGPEAALAEVEAMREALEATLAGRPPEGLLWRRLAEVHADYALPSEPLYELLAGARWDLSGRGIEALDDLLAYSELVAGSVGAMMLPFLAPDRAAIPALVPTARALGNAMQITNILRDVGEDLGRLGRVYLPASLMRAHGLSRADLDALTRQGQASAAYVALLETVMAEAERLYRQAETGIAALPLRSRVGIAAAARMYREIMNEVRAAHYDNLGRRNYVPLARKLRLVVGDAYARRRSRLRAGLASVS